MPFVQSAGVTSVVVMERLRVVDVDQVAEARPEFWSQEEIAEANGSLFRAAKGIGQTTWHAHEDQDEVFLVTHGTLVVETRSEELVVGAGELLVVPRGVEHRPRAGAEVRFLIVGTSVTSNTAGGKPAWSHDGGTPGNGAA